MRVQWPGPDLFVYAYLARHPQAKKPLDYRDRHGMARVLGSETSAADAEGEE